MKIGIHGHRIPYAIAAIGTVISLVLAWFLDLNESAYLSFLDQIKHSLPLLTFLLGFSLSLLIAVVVRNFLLATESTATLDLVNQNLKKEMKERILAEETKQKLEVALLQGQKLQAMGTLASGIAHDFNNILYAIVGYVEMTREDVTEMSNTYKNLGKVLEAAHRGQELVSRILAFSRRQHHEFSILNLQSTIDAALQLLKPTIPSSVLIDFVAIDDMNILGNQNQIHQVLVNLINNAVYAMDGEGIVHLHLSRLPTDSAYLYQFPAIKKQDYCKIEVKDTGHGMDQATMERIFEPFFTTKEVGKGTGLGLSIVHSIIQEHQGEITVSSQLGQGTTFTIILPEYIPLGSTNG